MMVTSSISQRNATSAGVKLGGKGSAILDRWVPRVHGWKCDFESVDGETTYCALFGGLIILAHHTEVEGQDRHRL